MRTSPSWNERLGSEGDLADDLGGLRRRLGGRGRRLRGAARALELVARLEEAPGGVGERAALELPIGLASDGGRALESAAVPARPGLLRLFPCLLREAPRLVGLPPEGSVELRRHLDGGRMFRVECEEPRQRRRRAVAVTRPRGGQGVGGGGVQLLHDLLRLVARSARVFTGRHEAQGGLGSVEGGAVLLVFQLRSRELDLRLHEQERLRVHSRIGGIRRRRAAEHLLPLLLEVLAVDDGAADERGHEEQSDHGPDARVTPRRGPRA
jgi:hypothetical protein